MLKALSTDHKPIAGCEDAGLCGQSDIRLGRDDTENLFY
jgi:hypothetical protein